MKNKIKIGFLILLSLSFTGCIDIFHTVSLHKGRADITVRYTIQKAIFEMISSFSGEELDYSELTMMEESIFGEYEKISAEVQPINTPYNFGAEIQIAGPIREIRERTDSEYFLPIQNGKTFEILLPTLSDEEETDAVTLSFISGAKYTILVDLSGDLRDIKKARLEDGRILGEDNLGISVHIYGSSMLIEFPMMVMFMAPEDFRIELY